MITAVVLLAVVIIQPLQEVAVVLHIPRLQAAVALVRLIAHLLLVVAVLAVVSEEEVVVLVVAVDVPVAVDKYRKMILLMKK